ncbi:hypothetical protein [Schlesneria sp. DSM 10557]|uniref:hypothetical protein n=1 Tax=Schlesneria sp. DSM 10557 TaxID=3044399 RepID=UPI00359F6663
MNEMQEVVDELRFILQRDVVEQSEELTDLVRRYSNFCREINGRLRRCDDCLKRGLRSEALHLAQGSPDVLDAVAVLDFPELTELHELLSSYLITPPEPLLLDVAAALNSAYADHQPLEKTLEIHRLLALGRSPLSQRLVALRSLAALDTSSPHWGDDVRDMERARLRDIEAESADALKAGDVATLKALVSEISAEGWLTDVPPPLKRSIKEKANQAVRAHAQHRITELNTKLHEAFTALDSATALTLRDEWKQTSRVLQLGEGDALYEEVSPILAWLEDLDRHAADARTYENAVANIERALEDDHVTATALRKLKLPIDRLDRPLPSGLDSRYRTRLDIIETIERRRRKLIIGGSIAGAAILMGIFGFMVNLSVQADKTRRLVATAIDFINSGNLEEAQELLDEHAGDSSAEAWLDVRKQLAEAERTEKDRILQWKEQISTAQSSSDLNSIEAALKSARELSRTAEEKAEVGQLFSAWQKQAQAALAEKEKVFRAGIASATEALATLDRVLSSSDPKNEGAVTTALASAEGHVNRLRPLMSGVGKELTSQAMLLDSRLNASRQAITDLSRRSSVLTKITDAALMLPEQLQTSRPDNFVSALKEFSETFPDDPRAQSFRQAAELCPLTSVIAKQQTVEKWKKLRPVDQKDLESKLNDIRSFVSEHPQSPDFEQVRELQNWFESINRRFEEDGDPDDGIYRRLVALFNGKFIKEGHILIDRDNNTYYLPKPLTEPFGSTASFLYIIGFNNETRRDDPSLRPADLLTQTSIEPPQQKFAAEVRSRIREIAIHDWREFHQELSEKLLTDKKIDGFLRYLLLTKTLEYASQGDYFLAPGLEPILSKLNDEEMDRSVPWMDPKSTSAKKARERAAEIMAKLPSLPQAFAAASRRQEEFEREVLARRFSVGWLEKANNGREWACRTNWSPTDNHQLYVASRPDSNGSRKWLSIGTLQGGASVITSQIAAAVGEGSMVFATTANTDAKTGQVSSSK